MSSLKTFYKPELDGLRFFAFLWVFIYHMRKDFGWLAIAFERAGAYGVTLFFTLSAYLITTLLLKEMDKTGDINVKAFYVRRALRIWPLYYAALGIGGVMEHLPLHYGIPFLLFLGNWPLMFWGYPILIPHLWTVCVEEQFYFTWPYLVRCVGGRKGIVRLSLALMVTAMCMRVMLYEFGAFGYQAFPNTFVQLDSIAAGALLAVKLEGRKVEAPVLVRMLCAALGVLMITVINRYANNNDDLPLTLFSTVIAYPGVALGSVLIFLGAIDSRGILTARPVVYLGRISYGLYVFHMFVLAKTNTDTVPEMCRAFVLTVLLATLSYELFEKRFLRLKSRFSVA